jgi:hypothetical protein
MTLYPDTSALVKRYFCEPYSDEVLAMDISIRRCKPRHFEASMQSMSHPP